MRKILLLVNPLLQRTRARRRAVDRVLSTFRESGATVDLLETGENRAAGTKAKRAVAQGYEAIVVCGGDGTIFDVIQGLAGSDVPLGIIPFGTGNVMAQNLGIPDDPTGGPVPASQSILPRSSGKDHLLWSGGPAKLVVRHGSRHGRARCPDVGSAAFGKRRNR